MKPRLRYSLRLFLLVLVVVPAAVGTWVKRSLDQPKHVRYLQGLGLKVIYDLDEAASDGFIHRARLWLASRIGKDFVAVPVAIETSATARETVYTEDFEILARLSWLRRIELSLHQEIDDEALSHLTRLPRIEWLTVNSGFVTDGGLQAVSSLTRLRHLDVRNATITDAGMRNVARINALDSLSLSGDMTDQGLEELTRLPCLKSVSLSSNLITDKGVAVLARLPCLEFLFLDSRSITDRGVAEIENCRSLKNVRLFVGDLVSDGALNDLRRRYPGSMMSERLQRHIQSARPRRNLIAHQRPDRVLTGEKREILNAALTLLNENEMDMHLKHRLMRRIHETYSGQPVPEPDLTDPDIKLAMDTLTSDCFFDDAFRELTSIGHVDAIPALERFVRDTANDRDWRMRAMDALGHIADRRVMPILIDLLEDSEPHLAFEAWRYLHALTGRSVGEELIWQDFDPHNAQPARPELVAAWRKFWKENGDVLRPRRAVYFGM